MLKTGYPPAELNDLGSAEEGTCKYLHKLSPKRLQRHINEPSVKHHIRGLDTKDQITEGMQRNRLMEPATSHLIFV